MFWCCILTSCSCKRTRCPKVESSDGSSYRCMITYVESSGVSPAASVYFCAQYTSYKILLSLKCTLAAYPQSAVHFSIMTSSFLSVNVSQCDVFGVVSKPEDRWNLMNAESVISRTCAVVVHTVCKNDVHLEGCAPLKESDRNRRKT